MQKKKRKKRNMVRDNDWVFERAGNAYSIIKLSGFFCSSFMAPLCYLNLCVNLIVEG